MRRISELSPGIAADPGMNAAAESADAPATAESLRAESFRCVVQDSDGRSFAALMEWLGRFRASPAVLAEKVSMAEVMSCRFGDGAVTTERIQDSVACLKTVLHEREVRAWCQPMMFDRRENLCGLLLRRSGRGIEALIQAVEEPGIINEVQLGPTVQTDQLRTRPGAMRQAYAPFFEDLAGRKALLDVVQSEEGGRFFRDKKRYAAIFVGEDELRQVDERYRWVSVADIKRAIAATNTVNIFARTLATLLF